MREYIDGKPVQDVARKVIAKWHTDLDNPKILYLIDVETMKSRGFETLAKIRKATPVESHLNGGLDLVLIVSGPIWKAMTDEQKLALIDHELCHVELTSPESGEPGAYLLRGHDIEEFNVIVKRHGEWWPHVAAFNFVTRLSVTHLSRFDEGGPCLMTPSGVTGVPVDAVTDAGGPVCDLDIFECLEEPRATLSPANMISDRWSVKRPRRFDGCRKCGMSAMPRHDGGPMISLTLPMPPSANAYWRSICINDRPRVLTSKAARRYKKDVTSSVVAQLGGFPEMLEGGSPLRCDLLPQPRRRPQPGQGSHGRPRGPCVRE